MTEQQGNTTTLAREEVEWGLNMESEITLDVTDWPNKFIEKGRCKRCWGGLFGRTNEVRTITGINCRVCGTILKGTDAHQEEKRMSNEAGLNLINMCLGRLPTYNDGVFAYKIFPQMDRLTEQEHRKHVSLRAAQGKKPGKLTRCEFPIGTPGYFFLQALILMAGIEQPINPNELSVVEFPDFDLKDDRTAVVRLSREKLGKSSWQHEYGFMGRLGTTMSHSMMSAFACELVMKSISLTCNDEAERTHDFIDLYSDLPQPSRDRIEADCPEIEEVLERGRHVFDKWRYFQHAPSGQAMTAMIESERARALGKAARVILDEAEMMGLWGKVKIDAKQDFRVEEGRRHYRIELDATVTGGEWPPRA